MGKAYFLTNEKLYFETFWSQFISWTKNNPFLLGVNWLSAMEVALRINQWMLCYTLFCKCPLFSRDRKVLYWRWLYIHIYYLRYHFTLDDRGFRNNHLIIEAASLFIVAICLKEFKEATTWLKKSLSTLLEEIDYQFLEDGFHYELSTSYHLQVTEAYVYSSIIAYKSGYNLPQKLKQSITKMVNVLNVLSDQNGNLPLWGDGDDGRFLGLSTDNTRLNCNEILNNYYWSSFFTKERIYSRKYPMPNEGAYWFLGKPKPFGEPTTERRKYSEIQSSRDEVIPIKCEKRETDIVVLNSAQVGIINSKTKGRPENDVSRRNYTGK